MADWIDDFSVRLIQVRKKKKLTQKQVAKQLGLSVTTISGYENGIKLPSIKRLRVLAQFYDTSADYLLGLSPYKALSIENLSKEQARILEELLKELENK